MGFDFHAHSGADVECSTVNVQYRDDQKMDGILPIRSVRKPNLTARLDRLISKNILKTA